MDNVGMGGKDEDGNRLIEFNVVYVRFLIKILYPLRRNIRRRGWRSNRLDSCWSWCVGTWCRSGCSGLECARRHVHWGARGRHWRLDGLGSWCGGYFCNLWLWLHLSDQKRKFYPRSIRQPLQEAIRREIELVIVPLDKLEDERSI